MLTRRVFFLCVIECLIFTTIIPLSLQNPDYSDTQPEYAPGTDDHGLVEDDGAPAANQEGNEIGAAGNDDAPPAPTEESEVADDDQSEGQKAADPVADPDIEVTQHIDEPTAVITEADDGDDNDGTETPDVDGDADEAATEASATTETNEQDDDNDDDAIPDTSATCTNSNSNDEFKDTITDLSGKIEALMGVIDNINGSIQRMETLVQSTIVDERLYKCISAISNGNQSQALKYWKQILRHQIDSSKRATIFKQIVKDAYLGKEENLLPVIKFIEATKEYYGYETLFEQLKSFNQIYHHKSVFTLANYMIKGCGRSSELFKLMPPAVQSINAKYFTLQSKFNKGYLYYAKRCVARHYYYCLDVLTKKIETRDMDFLDSEEKGRYRWMLNATDHTVSKFFIVNQDKYWSYRLQDVNNSPRFKMEETGNNFESELAHFQLELSTDNEIAIQIRETNIYLEGEELKGDNASEVLLHSFHKSDSAANSSRMNWLVQSVDDSITDGYLADNDNCKIVSNGNNNGNGNGGR